ncbi:MAG TPA: CsbD family protein [Steroidobacteraceae bacterium]|nr:CsbD family protein [Steroidobacteraceae bacterium]
MSSGLNKDQIKGSVKDIGGKIQEGAGRLVGSKKQQIKGLEKQAEGKVQQQVGDLKAAVEDATKS